MFKIFVLIIYLAAPGLIEERTSATAVSDALPTYLACVQSYNHQGTGIQIGLRIRAAAKSVTKDGSLIESLQISCRKT